MVCHIVQLVNCPCSRLRFEGLYNDTVPTEIADVYNGSLPNAVVRRIHQRTVPYTAQTTDK